MKSLYINLALLCAFSLLTPQSVAMEGREGLTIVSESQAVGRGLSGVMGIADINVTVQTLTERGYVDKKVEVPINYEIENNQKVVYVGLLEDALAKKNQAVEKFFNKKTNQLISLYDVCLAFC